MGVQHIYLLLVRIKVGKDTAVWWEEYALKKLTVVIGFSYGSYSFVQL